MRVARLNNGRAIISHEQGAGGADSWTYEVPADQVAAICRGMLDCWPEFFVTMEPPKPTVNAAQFWEVALAICDGCLPGGSLVTLAKRLGFWPPPDAEPLGAGQTKKET